MYRSATQAAILIMIPVFSLGAGFLPIEPGITSRQEAEALVAVLPAGVAEVRFFYDADEKVEAARIKLEQALPERLAPLLFALRGRAVTAEGDLFSGRPSGKTVSHGIDGVHFSVAAGKLRAIWLLKPGVVPGPMKGSGEDLRIGAAVEDEAPAPVAEAQQTSRKIGAKQGLQVRVLTLKSSQRGGQQYITVCAEYNARELRGRTMVCSAYIYSPKGGAPASGEQVTTVSTGNLEWCPVEVNLPVEEVNRAVGGEDRIMISFQARCDDLQAKQDLEWLSPSRKKQGEQQREVVIDAVRLALDRDSNGDPALAVSVDCVPNGLEGERLVLNYQFNDRKNGTCETTIPAGRLRVEGFGCVAPLDWLSVIPGQPFCFTLRLEVGSGPYLSLTEQTYEGIWP